VRNVTNVTNVTIVIGSQAQKWSCKLTTEFTGYTEKYTERAGENVMNVIILTRNGVSNLAKSKKSV